MFGKGLIFPAWTSKICIVIMPLYSGNGVTEETRSCYLLLLISLAKESESTKMAIIEQKGIEISSYVFILLNDFSKCTLLLFFVWLNWKHISGSFNIFYRDQRRDQGGK